MMTACDDGHRDTVMGGIKRPLVHKLEFLVLFMLGSSTYNPQRGVNLIFRVNDPSNYLFTWHDEKFRNQVMAYLALHYKANEYDLTVVYNRHVDGGFSFGPHKARMRLREHMERRGGAMSPDGTPVFMFSVEELPRFTSDRLDD
jgi:hypothetical protein